ncbi:MAG: pyridoxal phosphate-dependent aminotransferase [Bacteroidales bacterium]|nr:pyridoxal phosphate-dependent aminotransferase [Bacteroidales bacterium]
MMYNFDKIVCRKGSGCVKWDAKLPMGVQLTDEQRERLIPLWVADMDFEAPQFIREALQKRLDHGVFGYECAPDTFYSAIIRWWATRHGLSVQREWILHTPGVVPALSAVIKAFAKPGEGVIIQSPSYNCFFSSVRNNDSKLVDVPLLRRDLPDGQFTYEYDYAGIERACADPSNKVLLLCNPHNPAGRVWTADELRRVGEIALRHRVTVISDEIHCEIVGEGHTFTPFASLGPEFLEGSVTLSSHSKSFNVAGLHTSFLFCKREDWRAMVDKAINVNEICGLNVFGPAGLEACYSPEGARWLAEMNAYIQGNYELLRSMLSERLPQLPVCVLEGTYLAWIYITPLGISADDLEIKLLREAQVWVNSGRMYGSDGYIRINLACPRSLLKEALNRIIAILAV